MQNIFLSSLLIIKDCSLSKAGSLFWLFCAAHLSGSMRPVPCFAPFAARSAAGFLPGLHGMQEACGSGQQSGQQPALDALWVGLAALSLHAAFTGLGPSRLVLQAPGIWQGGGECWGMAVCVCVRGGHCRLTRFICQS